MNEFTQIGIVFVCIALAFTIGPLTETTDYFPYIARLWKGSAIRSASFLVHVERSHIDAPMNFQHSVCCVELLDRRGKRHEARRFGIYREVVSIKAIKSALVRYTENKRPGRFGC